MNEKNVAKTNKTQELLTKYKETRVSTSSSLNEDSAVSSANKYLSADRTPPENREK